MIPVLATREMITFSFQAASGHVFCCQDFMTLSVLVSACLESAVDQVPL